MEGGGLPGAAQQLGAPERVVRRDFHRGTLLVDVFSTERIPLVCICCRPSDHDFDAASGSGDGQHLSGNVVAIPRSRGVRGAGPPAGGGRSGPLGLGGRRPRRRREQQRHPAAGHPQAQHRQVPGHHPRGVRRGDCPAAESPHPVRAATGVPVQANL